jgi:ABC-type multidrug transport system ATPase subunit
MLAQSGANHVESRGLRKAYGLLPVLRGIDLTVPAGQILALLGANGAGKSTLLRCLGGVCRPTGGRLAILGSECHPTRPPREVLGRIGFVAHEPLVYLDLTPRQNLGFFARLHRVPAGRADHQIERFGLGRVAERRTRTLSRGTLQRLSLARALLHEPRLLLLDEPFTGLDEAGQELLCAALAESARAGATVVLVSHDLGRVAAIADRVVILANGRIAVDQRPSPAAPELAALYRDVTAAGRHVGDAAARPTGSDREDLRVDDRP